LSYALVHPEAKTLPYNNIQCELRCCTSGETMERCSPFGE